MIVAIDESGNFEPTSSDMHWFAATHIRRSAVIDSRKERQFLRWEGKLPESRREKGEVKGRLLAEADLDSFVDEVAEPDPPLGLTPITIIPSDSPLEAQHADRMLSLATCNSTVLECVQAGNDMSAQFFRDLGKWLRGLSDQLYLKNIVMGECVALALADAIRFGIDGGYSEELAGLELMIDKDFVKEGKQARAWLATVAQITRRVQERGDGVSLPAEWRDDHPFLKKFGGRDNLDLAPLFKEHVFFSSDDHWELRVADVAAVIFRRAHGGRGGVDALARLAPLCARRSQIPKVIVTGRFNPQDERRGSGR